MRLSAIPIVNFANINQYSTEDQWKIRAGELNTLYFQLVDLDQDKLRYLPGIGSQNQPYGVIVNFPSIDDSKEIMIQATQTSASDNSIWQVTISPAQTPNSGNVIFMVYEGNVKRTFKLLNGLSVEFPGTDGSC